MRKIYHLGTCKTCQRIIAQLNANEQFELQNIKTHPITGQQLDWLRERVGSYESLFSRRSRQYRPRGLHERKLSETDYRDLILEEYSFLKRPVVVVDEQVFVGNSQAAVAGAQAAIDQLT